MSEAGLREHLRSVLRKEVASLKRRRGSALLAEGRKSRHSHKGTGIFSDVAGLLGLGRKRAHKSKRHTRKGEGIISDVAGFLGLGRTYRAVGLAHKTRKNKRGSQKPS